MISHGPWIARNSNSLSNNTFQRDFRKSIAQDVIQQNGVAKPIPDGTQANTSRSMQNELISTAASAALQFEFRHWKVVFKKIFFPAEFKVNELSEVVQSTNVR